MGQGGIFNLQEFIPLIAYARVFFRWTPFHEFFLVDRHYYLAFSTIFNNEFVYLMQYESSVQFFKIVSISCFVDGTCLVALSCWWSENIKQNWGIQGVIPQENVETLS